MRWGVKTQRWLLVSLLLMGLAPLLAEDQPGAPAIVTTGQHEGRHWLSPWQQMFRGYAQFDLAPPHNEIDPDLCSASAGTLGGMSSPCTAFGRYMLSGYVEIRPFAQTPLRRGFLFGEPRFLFGRNLPQTMYTWSMDPIGWERSWGLGITMGKGFELRATQHFLFNRLGARDRNLGPADLGPNGPWGRYNVIGVRKYFGNWNTPQ